MASSYSAAVGVVPSIPVCLGSILSQLPSQLFRTKDKAELSSVNIAVPGNLILPQLASGKISVSLADLVPLLPADLLHQPLQIASEQQSIVLPLAEIIASIPPDALSVQHESAIAIDTPEFNALPKLFDDSLLQDSAEPVAEEIPATVNSAATPVPTEEPLAVAETTITSPEPAHPSLISDVPDHVMISLRSLVVVMPDYVFACPRADLWRKADFDLPVPIPVEPILPQLKTARVKLPLSKAVELVPPSLLANPLPPLKGETVPLPLEEIVPQLPPRLFTTQLRDPEPQEFELADVEIPAPFQERGEEAVELVPSDEIVQGQTQIAEIKPPEIPVEPAALDDETFKIFAEKPAAVELPEIESLEEAEATLTNTNQAPSIEPIAKQTEATAVPCAPAESLPETVAELGGIIENKFLIDLNRCTVEDLQTIQGVGPALAKRIIEFRDARGQFTSIEELREIPGIGRKTFRALAGIEPRALNRLLGVEHDRELSLQEIVRLTSALPGVDGCMLAMSDGLFLTGELPPHLDRSAVSVFAPQLFKKVGHYMRELRVGQIRRFTIFTDQQPLSIFRAGDVYLIVIHDTRHFSKALLRRCERISQEIAHLCRQRAVV
ncbi:MAG: helix-hairpin-helix domain-containing protein [Verrucomicrobiia bacterium]